MNFSLSVLPPFLYSGLFPPFGIKEKINGQEPVFGKLIFSHVKCHLMYFVLIPGELVFVHGEN